MQSFSTLYSKLSVTSCKAKADLNSLSYTYTWVWKQAYISMLIVQIVEVKNIYTAAPIKPFLIIAAALRLLFPF